MDLALKTYVEQAVGNGHSLKEIQDRLKAGGYSEEDVSDALKLAGVVQRGYFKRLVNVITEPVAFFALAKDEEGLLKSIKFLAATMLLYSVLNLGLFVVFQKVFTKMLGSGAADIPLGLLAPIIIAGPLVFALAGSFVFAGVIHLFARLLGGEGNYEASYKALAYSSAVLLPGLFISFAPMIGPFIVAVWSFVLALLGLSSFHSVSKAKAVMILLVPGLILIGILVGGFIAISFLSGPIYLPPPPSLPGQTGLQT
ncbi:MAG TPA: Yip1 family protein, partial [Candidatus Nanoarchaeia archaeon]|nr:Yip1 family protein [Candidatus Nanoarchaeia archaeon]